MPVRKTSYGKNRKRTSKKRTVLPTRKQAMSYRHKTIHNTAICPDGERLINGKCSHANGVQFSGHTFTTKVPLSEVQRNTTGGNYLYLSYSRIESENFIPKVNREARNLSPSWIRYRSMSTSNIMRIADFLTTIPFDKRILKVVVGKAERAKVSTEATGRKLYNSILNDLPPSVRDFISDLSNEDDNDGGNQVTACGFVCWGIIVAIIIILL